MLKWRGFPDFRPLPELLELALLVSVPYFLIGKWSCIIKPADKGNRIVIMNTSYYNEAFLNKLQDKEFYETSCDDQIQNIVYPLIKLSMSLNLMVTSAQQKRLDLKRERGHLVSMVFPKSIRLSKSPPPPTLRPLSETSSCAGKFIYPRYH